MGMVKGFAIFISWELFLIFLGLIIMGAFTDPLPAVVGICTAAGTNPFDLSVTIFVIGSLLGVFVMCLVAIAGGGPWN